MRTAHRPPLATPSFIRAMLPIPGTTSVAHLKENLAAAAIRLTPEEVAALTQLVPEDH
ncbi:MAG TPA: aldo/keto reductase [Ktedonobacteraceae bacterium]